MITFDNLNKVTFPSLILLSLGLFAVVLNIHPIVRVFLVFISFCIIPGMLLQLVFMYKLRWKYEIIPFIVNSFFISITVSVIILFVLLPLNIPLTSFSFNFSLLTLSFVMIVLLFILSKRKALDLEIVASRFDLALLFLVLTLYFVIIALYFPDRTLDNDETLYINFSRRIVLNKEVLTTSQDPLASPFQNLFSGRLYWLSLIAAYKLATGLEWNYVWLMGSMFIPMTALSTSMLVNTEDKYNNLLKISSILLLMSNPLVLTFGRSIQPDLAQTFFTSLAAYFAVTKGFIFFEDNKIAPCLSNIVSSLIVLFVSYTVRENLAVIVAFSVLMITLSARYKLWKLWKLTVLIIGFSIVFIILASLAIIKPQNIVASINLSDPYFLLRCLYTIISPEALSPLIALSVIILPVIVVWFTLKNQHNLWALSCITFIMFLVTFTFSLSDPNFLYNISRYELFLVPFFIIVSLKIFSILLNSEYYHYFLVPFSIFIIVWVNQELNFVKGYVYYAIPYEFALKNTFTIISTLFFAIYVTLAAYGTLTKHKELKFLEIKRNKIVNTYSIVLSFILLISLLSNLYFSNILAFSYSKYSQKYDLTNLQVMETIRNNAPVLMSNFYYYIRCYIDDDTFSRIIPLSLPIDEQEFLENIQILPNNTILLFTDDPRLAWHDYGNKYIMKYLFQNSTTDVDKGLVLFLSFDEDQLLDETGNNKNITLNNVSVIEGKIAKALYFNGINSNVIVPNSPYVSITNSLTIEAWVKCDESPLGNYRTIVRKEGAYAFRFDPLGRLEAIIWQNNTPVTSGSIPAKDSWVPNEWVHWVFTYDGNFTRIYKNGNEVLKTFRSGNIDDTNTDLGIGSSGIGAYPFKGALDEVRIYNRALSSDEIRMQYLYGLGYRNITFVGSESIPKGKIMVYRINSTTAWKMNQNTSTIKINSLAIVPAKDEKSDVMLSISVWSKENSYISIIINTYRFAKILKTDLTSGLNEIRYNFSYYLSNGLTCGSQIQGWAEITIIDSQGSIIFKEDLAAFKLNPHNVITYVLPCLCTAMIILYLHFNKGKDEH